MATPNDSNNTEAEKLALEQEQRQAQHILKVTEEKLQRMEITGGDSLRKYLLVSRLAQNPRLLEAAAASQNLQRTEEEATTSAARRLEWVTPGAEEVFRNLDL